MRSNFKLTLRYSHACFKIFARKEHPRHLNLAVESSPSNEFNKITLRIQTNDILR